MNEQATVRVVYEGPEAHVHVGDRAFDRGRVVDVPADELDALRVALEDGTLEIVEDE